jgi:hemerythrin-like domain-containing protein
MTTNNPGKPEILELIHSEHEEVRALFEQFQDSQSASESEDQARSIAEQLFGDLKLHSELEEKIVYPSLKEQDVKLFYEAGAEHHVADLLMEEMREMPVSAPEYAARMTVMQTSVEHHIQEEESEIFELLGQLSPDDLERMAQEWKQQKQQAMQEQVAH